MWQPKLLTRDNFRESTFERDDHKCVFCEKDAQDAHHIMERRLWTDGGYYIENGASVCDEHHILCETTEISVEQVREACAIKHILVPQHLYSDQAYDKWGNPIMPNGTRLRGDLFYDESVQKILAKGKVLGLFTHHVKYPRTPHMPWSPGMNDDDRVVDSMDRFKGKRVIVTRKMDGENTTMYQDHFHARSVDSPNHPSRSWAKNFWSTISADIPPMWRVCAENLYAQHSIAYDDLDSFLLGFSIWNERNKCLDWDATTEWFELLNMQMVPVLYDGIYDEELVKSLWQPSDWETSEGLVMRLAEEFDYADFRYSIVKFVREKHVQTNKHWMRGQPITPNKIKAAAFKP